MKKFFFLYVVIFSTIISYYSLYSQIQAPCDSTNDYAYYFWQPKVQSYPPLSTDMSYDVLIGYIACDSIIKAKHLYECNDFLKRQTYNDSIRYIMRYFYQMVDYDPIKFWLYSRADCIIGMDNYRIQPSFIADDFLPGLLQYSPYPILDYYLLGSYIIAHVSITDTSRIYPRNTIICKNLLYVNCTVLDIIKGQVLPPCNYPAQVKGKNGNNKTLTNECLQFIYCCEWQRNTASYESLCDSAGNAWVKKNNEYIIFLEPRLLCTDSINVYIELTPLGINSNKSFEHGMFAIENGNVIDPANEFGFGPIVPVNILKSSIRNRISGNN